MMFMSIPNHKKLMTVLDSFFNEKYGLHISMLDESVLDLKKLVFEKMRAVQAKTPGASDAEKNKAVLREAKDVVFATYTRLKAAADAQEAAEQQRLLGSRRALPDAPSDGNGDVMTGFAALQQARTSEWSMATPKPMDASSAAADVAFTDDELAHRVEVIQRRRGEDDFSAPRPYKVDDGSNMMRAAADEAPLSLTAASSPSWPASTSAPKTPRTTRLLISSADRDVVAFPSRFSFKVRFGRSGTQAVTMEVASGVATIPGTRTLHSEGVPNAHGYHHAGSNYAAVGGTLPSPAFGNVTVRIPSDGHAAVTEVLENVSRATIEAVTVAFRTGSAVPPLLTVSVPEMEGDVDGTSDGAYRALTILTAKTVLPAGPNGMMHVVYERGGEHGRVFFPPIAHIRYAVINLRDANGLPIADRSNDATISDGANVLNVDHVAGTLVVTLATAMDFAAGDTVRLQEVAFFAVDAATSSSTVESANAFVGRFEGHFVRAVASAGTVLTVAAPSDVGVCGFLHAFGGSTSPYAVGRRLNGYAMNLSRQVAIDMTVWQERTVVPSFGG
jgi:hypothetical protein